MLGHSFSITTLTLGSRPRQGLARVRAKREVRDSHFMFSKVEESVRNEPSHSQMSSHFENWNLGGLLNF